MKFQQYNPQSRIQYKILCLENTNTFTAHLFPNTHLSAYSRYRAPHAHKSFEAQHGLAQGVRPRHGRPLRSPRQLGDGRPGALQDGGSGKHSWHGRAWWWGAPVVQHQWKPQPHKVGGLVCFIFCSSLSRAHYCLCKICSESVSELSSDCSTIQLLYPHHKMWGGGVLYWIRFVASVGRSIRLQFVSAL